jgi:DNA-binding transcriptional LysR family regulator
VIGPFAATILKAAPHARVSVIQRPANRLSERLASGDIDFSVAIRPVALTSLPIQPLFYECNLCTVRDGHPLRFGRIAANELCAFDHAFVGPTAGSFRGPMDAVLERVGLRRRVAASVPTFAMLFDLLRKTDLVAFIPSRLAGAQTGLRTMEADLEIKPLELVANWHPRLALEPRHIWLRQTLPEVIARLHK